MLNSSWKDVVGGLGWGLGYFGMQHILVRFMSIEKPSMVKKSAVVAIIWVILSLGAACLIAYFGRILLAEELLPAGAQAIMNPVENAWAGFGSAFGPTIILPQFWRRFTYKGAVAGMVTGGPAQWSMCFG